MHNQRIFILLAILFFGTYTAETTAQINESTITLNPDLKIVPLSNQVYLHQSWAFYPSFGKVQCNGLLYINKNEAVLMDTPDADSLSLILLDWIEKEKNAKLKAVIINHHHSDCLGGLNTFHEAGIPSYATKKCLRLAKKEQVVIPQYGFRKKLDLKIGGQTIQCRYFGKAHTADNLVVYIPSEQTLFGGCMVKSLNSGKGNLADASVKKWSKTIQKVKLAFPKMQYVIPGHGKHGGVELLDYTIEMFE